MWCVVGVAVTECTAARAPRVVWVAAVCWHVYRCLHLRLFWPAWLLHLWRRGSGTHDTHHHHRQPTRTSPTKSLPLHKLPNTLPIFPAHMLYEHLSDLGALQGSVTMNMPKTPLYTSVKVNQHFSSTTVVDKMNRRLNLQS